jgi:hypothetical protein
VEKGIHPAVTTFWEAKPDCFYKVESKPGGGKSFVTARGWEDLASVISLYEEVGAPCDSELFSQFLRDDDIADRFSIYYTLFEKYRSDYQISMILEGAASREVVERAKGALFDERVALLGLVLDALAVECARALDQQELVMALRDELRSAKPKLIGGATVEETVVSALHAREDALARKEAGGTVAQVQVRAEKLFIRRMRDIAGACTAAGVEAGPEAFEVVNAAYRTDVDAIEPLVSRAQNAIERAIAFVEDCFGDGREMLVFLAELSTRTVTMRFISHFGSAAYYEHSNELKVDEARDSLSARVRELVDIREEIKSAQFLETQALDMGGAAGLGHTDSNVAPASSSTESEPEDSAD